MNLLVSAYGSLAVMRRCAVSGEKENLTLVLVLVEWLTGRKIKAVFLNGAKANDGG